MARLSVSKRTLDSLMQRRLIPYIKIGRSVRFDPQDVEEVIRKRRVGAVGELNRFSR